MMATKVFISYRRDDSAGHAGRVHDRLEREFGRDLLFMDVDSVPLGVNFVAVLSEEVAKCDVLLAVIGPNWLNARDEDGSRRLDNPHDFVRVEIGAALQRSIPVIPILLDGAKVPKANQLPKELEELSLRNGLDVRHASFHNDVDRLIRGLKEQLPEADAEKRRAGEDGSRPQKKPQRYARFGETQQRDEVVGGWWDSRRSGPPKDERRRDRREQLIWQGKPSPARYALRKAAYTFPAGIFFFGFSLFWIYGLYMSETGFAFWMFGIPFVIVGACMVLSPAWHLFRATNTTYTLTDRRAIIDISGLFPRGTSVPLNQVPFVDVRSSNEGRGHVLFQEAAPMYYGMDGGMKQRDGFIAIADAAKVGQMLKTAIQKSTAARPARS
jgi:TIR domain